MGRLERAGRARVVGDARLRGQGIRKDKGDGATFVCMTREPGVEGEMVMPEARGGCSGKAMAFSSTAYRVGTSCLEMLLSRLRCGGLREESLPAAVSFHLPSSL